MSIEVIDISKLACERCLLRDYGCNCLLQSEELHKLRSALTSSGFIQVINHGVEDALISDAFRCSAQFFSKGIDEKMRHESKDKARRGFSPMSAENFASLAGDQKPNDTVEKYRIGPNVSPDMRNLFSSYYEHREAKVHFFENDWKDLPSHSVDCLKTYYQSMWEVSCHILRIIELAVDLRSGFFKSLVDKHTSILTLNHYPPLPATEASEAVTRVAEHVDVSMLTVVAQCVSAAQCGDVGGLEVLDTTSNKWVAVPYTPNAFVVNVGDCLSDWSCGLFKSSMHRVVMKGATDSDNPVTRLSMAYFFAPNYDAELSWPPSVTSDHLDTVKAMDYTTWRKNRVKRAIQMLNKK